VSAFASSPETRTEPRKLLWTAMQRILSICIKTGATNPCDLTDVHLPVTCLRALMQNPHIFVIGFSEKLR
jgi:hypothetical protein